MAADIIIEGEVYASLRACMDAGLPPWLAAPDIVTEAYCRTDMPESLLQALARFRTLQAGVAEISWAEAAGGVQWSIRPRDRDRSERLLNARNRRGLSSVWI